MTGGCCPVGSYLGFERIVGVRETVLRVTFGRILTLVFGSSAFLFIVLLTESPPPQLSVLVWWSAVNLPRSILFVWESRAVNRKPFNSKLPRTVTARWPSQKRNSVGDMKGMIVRGLLTEKIVIFQIVVLRAKSFK